jgi:hypothetical protein
MDPITAFAVAAKAIAEMVTEIVRGQPPEVKEKMWKWYVEDVERWRRLFKLDDESEPTKVKRS